MPRLALLAFVALSLDSTYLRAQDKDRQEKGAVPAPVLAWRQAAAKAGLDAQAIEQLERNKFVIARREYKQIFDPYVESKLPVFITADSLLSGFHVLYEESILRLESSHAAELPALLRKMWTEVRRWEAASFLLPEEIAPALLRAKVVLGTAVQLLDPWNSVADDEELQALIDAEVAKVIAAEAVEKPDWLGPPDEGFVAIDYGRFMPRGFYAKTSTLQRYFRAVSWLQAIPFRVSKDDELWAILFLGRSLRDGDERLNKLLSEIEHFAGAADDWDIRTASACFRGDLNPDVGLSLNRHLAPARKSLARRLRKEGGKSNINDQLAFAADNPAQQVELSFRVISASRTPDGLLFQRTTYPKWFERPFPDGLEVCAALGSRFARSRLERKIGPELTDAIDDCGPFFRGEHLYQQYLHALAALLDEPEPDAPEFLSTDAWHARSCQAALAGWAQLRHTWALQAKVTGGFFGGAPTRPGFIEPEPEFFARMASLVQQTGEALKESKALQINPYVLAGNVQSLIDRCEEHDVEQLGFFERSDEGNNSNHESQEYLDYTELILLRQLGAKVHKDDDGEDPKRTMAKLRALADELGSGKMPDDPELVGVFKQFETNIAALWPQLAALCLRLESLAHKQLRRVPLNKDDEMFIKGYGETLAHMMLYQSNTYLVSNDDAPRIVDVFFDPNSSRALEVGIGRPRAMFVLYPFGEEQVLCRGAVSTYYEFPHEERLDDAQWKSLLDSPDRPKQPDWVPLAVEIGEPADDELDEEFEGGEEMGAEEFADDEEMDAAFEELEDDEEMDAEDEE